MANGKTDGQHEDRNETVANGKTDGQHEDRNEKYGHDCSDCPKSQHEQRKPEKLKKCENPQKPNTNTSSRTFARFMPDNLHSYLMSSKGHVSLITMDIDDKSALAPVEEFLRENGIPRTIVETRGGYHLFFDVRYSSALFSKPKFREFTKLHSTGDIFCPIPGTYQGGFPVRFVD